MPQRSRIAHLDPLHAQPANALENIEKGLFFSAWGGSDIGLSWVGVAG